MGTEQKGGVGNGIGSGEAKEFICKTHGHELQGEGVAGGTGSTRQKGAKGEKWDNCNSIINILIS